MASLMRACWRRRNPKRSIRLLVGSPSAHDDPWLNSSALVFRPQRPPPRIHARAPARPTPRHGDEHARRPEMRTKLASMIEKLSGQVQALADAQAAPKPSEWVDRNKPGFRFKSRPEPRSAEGHRSQGANRPLGIEFTCWQECGARRSHQDRLRKMAPALQVGGRSQRREVQYFPRMGRSTGNERTKERSQDQRRISRDCGAIVASAGPTRCHEWDEAYAGRYPNGNVRGMTAANGKGGNRAWKGAGNGQSGKLWGEGDADYCPKQRHNCRKKGVHDVDDEDAENAGAEHAQDRGDIERCPGEEAHGASAVQTGASDFDDLRPGLVNFDSFDPWAKHLDATSEYDAWAAQLRKAFGEPVLPNITRRPKPPLTTSAWRSAISSMVEVSSSVGRFRAMLTQAPLSGQWRANLCGRRGARPWSRRGQLQRLHPTGDDSPLNCQGVIAH